MKIKTSELIGSALDWAVAKCKGYNCYRYDGAAGRIKTGEHFNPSTDWAQGGPIIEREGIWVNARCENVWDAYKKIKWDKRWKSTLVLTGNTYLIAAMRCYVASKMGDEVDVPKELI